MAVLYVVSTPIGNLEDLTLRAIRILGEVSLILAEDTRRTHILLRHLGLNTPLRSHHRHNEESRIREVLDALDRGENLALVSDAGTPLVSDPGDRLVPRVVGAGHQVIPVPGPSAVLAALVVSGFPAVPFLFLGFPPRKGRARVDFLARVVESSDTVVCFESPERLGVLLQTLADRAAPDRAAVVTRELTKLHEEARRGTLRELATYYEKETPRGEVTLVVAPRSPEASDSVESGDEEALRVLSRHLLDQGASPSEAARELARRFGVPRNRAYAVLQSLDRADPEVS